MTTFEKILDQVTELPIDQQELLIDIITKRTAQIRRKELAITSQQALEEFKKGSLKPLTAEEAILELRSYLDNPEVE